MLARVLAEDSIDERVVDVAADRDGRVDLGELFDDEDGRRERSAGATVIRRSLDSHELFKATVVSQLVRISSLTKERKGEGKTYALVKQSLDDGRVHLFVLVHVVHARRDDVIRELFDYVLPERVSLGRVDEAESDLEEQPRVTDRGL